MSKIAVDVVLLPPENVGSACVKMCNELISEYKDNTIELDLQKCLPHITLAMVVIDGVDLKNISEEIDKIITNYLPIEMEFDKIHIEKSMKEDYISGIDIKKTEKLQKLHEEIMKIVSHYSKDEATIEALYPNPTPNERSLHWINGFNNHSSFNKYGPHITIGFGKLSKNNKVIPFKTDIIAICQLGNYCTCRKVLWKKKLH